jgi:hypothetical protein
MTVVSCPTIATGLIGFLDAAMTRISRNPSPGRLARSAPLAEAAACSGRPAVTYPSAIAELSGWRDTGAITSMLDPNGRPDDAERQYSAVVSDPPSIKP